MKKIKLLFLISAGAALILTAGLTTGCKTTSNADGTTTKTVDPIVLQVIAQDASAVGTSVFLQTNPQYRPAFELARTSIKALLAAGNGSPADLQAALAGLPLAQLKGTQGALIVSSAVTLIDLAGRQLQAADKKQVWATYVQPVAQGIADGLDQALGPTPSTP